MTTFLELARLLGWSRYIVLLAFAKRNLWRSGVNLDANVTNSDLVLLYLYTHQKLPVYHYKSINSVLRGIRHPKFDELLKLANMLTQALLKMPVHKGYCVRFVSLTKAEIRDYIPGNTVVFAAFTSSSADMSLFWKLNVRFTISSKSGRDISSVSRFPKEKEVLFPPKAQFLVLQNRMEYGISHIILEEV